MFDLLNSILQLLIEHLAVGDYDHAVEIRLAIGPTHTDQRMRRPGDSVGFARTGAVLDQIRLTCPLHPHGVDHLGHAFPLVEAREDQTFLEKGLAVYVLGFLALLQHEAVEDVQPVVLLQHPLPEVANRVAAVLTRWVASGTIVAAVEWQEEGRISSQLGGHADIAVAHGEMHHRATLEGQERLGTTALALRPAVHAVLLHGGLNRLGEVGFKLHGRNGNAIDEEGQVDLICLVQRVTQLR
ncbi:hypothetical protein D3C77_348480 [compost metagenome]